MNNHLTLNYEAICLEHVGVRYKTPDENLNSIKEYTIRRFQGRITQRDFWALQDINLSIFAGESIGLIGPNGAGKSTMVKLIARVLKPTRGRVVVRGKVAPLIEFGAGFHPELTGRENIYLNGALLGFSRQQMDEKFQEIVDFAELWDFIDSPMRTYSTGMWARLGFAVATDVNPDILIIDEALSVGDEAFQRKSKSRMQAFRDRGATILFVSHNLIAIEEMCHKVAWLDHGRLMEVGSPGDVISAYRTHQS
jgi:ABC-2 type transport system ATP-binding protein/lipopolysaccharide transport system ATP-binding protein